MELIRYINQSICSIHKKEKGSSEEERGGQKYNSIHSGQLAVTATTATVWGFK